MLTLYSALSGMSTYVSDIDVRSVLFGSKIQIDELKTIRATHPNQTRLIMSTKTCGEAIIDLLAAYGVNTVFGIPGVHNLELYRGLANSDMVHVQARHEQGAAFMADGYARVTGSPGVCIVISGPGVTNGLTALGQSFADSIPVLMISSTTPSYTLGKGWGYLHEVTDLQASTAPLTGLSMTAQGPEDLPEMLGKAFSLFSAERPRPVHIAIPIDILEMPVADLSDWTVRNLPNRPQPHPDDIEGAANLLASAKRPLIMLGGGAAEASEPITALAEKLNASVITSSAGKGIVPESHPLSLGGGIWRKQIYEHIPTADVVLAVGTELSETDSFVERLDFQGALIRIDIDPFKLNDLYPATIGIAADARTTVQQLLTALNQREVKGAQHDTPALVANLLKEMLDDLTENEAQHVKALNTLRQLLPAETIWAGDISQIVYSGAFGMPVDAPRLWHYPAGFCTLGCGLPNGIGAKLAYPERPVVVLAGDGGFMFTVQEMITAAELKLPIPIIIWENNGYLQIKEDMERRDIPPVGVQGINPDFLLLAQAMGCHGVRPDSQKAFEDAVTGALAADRPTLIELNQGSAWLLEG